MDSNKTMIENRELELKRLGFLRLISINAMVCVSNLYDYAKQNSGPLKSTVGTVETAVTTVVGPVYKKFNGVPVDLLVFLDDKVNEVATKFDEHAPPLAKQAVNEAKSLFQKASQVAQTFVQKAQVGGPSAAIHYAVDLYVQFWVNLLARFWYVTNQITAPHVLAQMAIPTVAYWSEKYNKTVADLKAKGYMVSRHLPQIPIDEIVKAYKQIEAERGPACAPCAAQKERKME